MTKNNNYVDKLIKGMTRTINSIIKRNPLWPESTYMTDTDVGRYTELYCLIWDCRHIHAYNITNCVPSHTTYIHLQSTLQRKSLYVNLAHINAHLTKINMTIHPLYICPIAFILKAAKISWKPLLDDLGNYLHPCDTITEEEPDSSAYLDKHMTDA